MEIILVFVIILLLPALIRLAVSLFGALGMLALTVYAVALTLKGSDDV